MEYENAPFSPGEPLSVWYEKIYRRIEKERIAPETRFDSCRDIAFLADPARWYEALAVCERAIDSGCDTGAVRDFFEWIFKGFDCNALVDLNAGDYDWIWHKLHGLFDKLAVVDEEALVEKALQYFSARRGYADKEKTLAYLEQAAERGSETAITILGYYLYLGMLGPVDKERGLELMDRAVSVRGKARVTVYKGYIALNEGRRDETERLMASLEPLSSDLFVYRLLCEQQAFFLESGGRPEEAAAKYREVLGLLPSGFAMLRLGFLHYGKKIADADPETGLAWIGKAFRYGRTDAAQALFYCYFESGETWQDDGLAVAWLEKGFAYNDGFCAYQLAYLYLCNEAYKDGEKGFFYLDEAIRLAYLDAFILKAYLYRGGEWLEKNLAACRDLLERAVKLGSGNAAFRLGCLYDCGEMSEDGAPDYGKALGWFEKAAEMNDSDGCEYAGRYRLVGTGAEPDPAKAKLWYEKGVGLGSPYCMVELAVMYDDGIGVEADFSKSLEYIRQAAAMGYAPGEYLLGRCYKYGVGLDEDPDEAIVWLQKAAAQDHPKAQAEMGLCYERGYGVEQDWVKAFDYMKLAAAQENEYAQYRLGYYYMYGLDHVPADYAEALTWLTRAADNGQPLALLELGDYYLYDYENKNEQSKAYPYYEQAARMDYVNEGLGLCLELGYGVEINEGEAFKYYLKGAEDGYLRAMFRAGLCYYDGTGVKENKAEAFRWFNEAAEYEDTGSVYYKGKMLLDGEGCVQNQEEGIALLRQAAEKEYKYAQFDLGNCYLAGKGVDENPDVAMEWFERAADNGHEQALKVTGRRRRR